MDKRFCIYCGNEIPLDSKFCSKCGKDQQTSSSSPKPMNDTSRDNKKASLRWILLPIFLGIVGGIIAAYCLRKRDIVLARWCLTVGIISLAIGIIIAVLTRL